MRKLIGFTLIEILIVMLIISIVGSVAILTINHNQNSQYNNFAKQLANYLILAEQQAMLQPATLGVSFSEKSFQFYQYQADHNNKNTWAPLTDSLLGYHRIPNNIHIKLVIEGKTISPATNTDKIIPYLIIPNSGDTPAFVIYIGKAGNPPSYRIISEGNGSIKSEPMPK